MMNRRLTDLARACAAARAEHDYAKEHVAHTEAAAAQAAEDAAAAAATAAVDRKGSTWCGWAAHAVMVARVRADLAGQKAAYTRARAHEAARRADLAAAKLERARHLEGLPERPKGASTRTGAQRAPAASISLLILGVVLLPTHQRPRWLEDWRGELGTLETRWARFRFVRQLLGGMPRMAWTLRYPAPSTAGAGSPRNQGWSQM
jgi:hypothetical protein